MGVANMHCQLVRRVIVSDAPYGRHGGGCRVERASCHNCMDSK